MSLSYFNAVVKGGAYDPFIQLYNLVLAPLVNLFVIAVSKLMYGHIFSSSPPFTFLCFDAAHLHMLVKWEKWMVFMVSINCIWSESNFWLSGRLFRLFCARIVNINSISALFVVGWAVLTNLLVQRSELFLKFGVNLWATCSFHTLCLWMTFYCLSL